MTALPQTFIPFDEGWTVRALNVDAVPEALREDLRRGIPAEVPGEVTLDLLRANMINDPFDGDNEILQQWIGNIDWQYQCDFVWRDDGKDRHDLLAFGLDTVTQILLNGRPIAATNNYHRSYRWDIDDVLQEGNNTLTVTIASSVRESDVREQRLGYYPHTEHHPFNQLRKPSYQFGWDWGIDIANAGIYRPIGIDSWSGSRIAEVRPLTRVDSHGAGIIDATVVVERADTTRVSSPCEKHRRGNIPVVVTLEGQGVSMSVQGEVESGRNNVTISVVVPDVKLWWPVGYGEQPLYQMRVDIENNDEDIWQRFVGFRNVKVDTAADAVGRPFQIYVNDIPVHARGYNWVPVDAFMSRASEDQYDHLFDDLIESHSNMIRAWGGSIYESDYFYELADRLGIMVWQDFALACAAYPEDAQTQAEIEAEAREHIIRLSSHPSLLVWNGSNENFVAYADWAGFKQSLRDDDIQPNTLGYGEKGWGNYYYSTLFPKLLNELDPTRIYLPSSPMSFTPHVDANRDTDGTMHIWDVWNRTDYRNYATYTPRFADEFGYQAPPAWSTLSRVVHDPQLEPFGAQMLVHQKAAGGNYKLARGMRSHLTKGHIDDVSYRSDGSRNWLINSDNWSDIEDWHWACQLQQAQAIRFGVEHMRSLEPVNAGILIWQLNDDWPVVSWSAVDYDGHRKPLWYASRDFFAPQFATIQPRVSQQAMSNLSWEGSNPECDVLALIVCNDTREDWSGSWRIERRTLEGKVLASQQCDLSLAALDHHSIVLNENVANWGDVEHEIIVATPSDDNFARVIYNACEVVDQDLDVNALQASVQSADSGYVLTLHARSYVRDAFCMVDKVDPAATVDGGMLTLLPGESVSWHITSRQECDVHAFTAQNVLRCANDLKR
ncbi:glycoside hydrolase family 2 protein [Bifidobacterium sp.]|jgi:beta-mannosidase|uniref:glycoside hydrolase family 2 protein n=1 Tax=Bifidobacterium sp. TaxID=41200 RepID=UPI0025BD325A|nr:glycoside hydrolase family 2 protein [Bifidobacterium sp.]MCI1634621.1 glycoside hydrolase family 2 protein [Bifidobacterium sp.]